LEKNGIVYDTILAEENAELAKKYGIMQAPTLVLVEGDTFTPYVGVPGVLKYINNK
jgi:ribonucleoside-triphosphate reductase